MAPSDKPGDRGSRGKPRPSSKGGGSKFRGSSKKSGPPFNKNRRSSEEKSGPSNDDRKASPYRGRRSAADSSQESTGARPQRSEHRGGPRRNSRGGPEHRGAPRRGSEGRRDSRGRNNDRSRGPQRKEQHPGANKDYSKKLVATCALGLELTVGRELEALGLGPISRDNAQVSFPYSPENIAKANYWLRTADRVWLQLAEFPARDFEELFQGVKAIDWPDMLPQDAWFPVEAISTKSKLESISSCQAITKKAACEKMEAHYGLSVFSETGPRFAIRVFIVYNRARVFLDTSGEGLHRRGYRTFNAKAPLRETVAAALVLLSHWSPGRELYDPLCGSGTILLEAAAIGLKKAAGMERSFAAQRWKFLGRECWEEVHTEALDLFDRRGQLKIFGSDNDGKVLKLANTHLEQAGLSGRGIYFQKLDVADFSSKRKYGVMITNPPYGKRLGTEEEVEDLTRTLSETFEPLQETWSLYYYTGYGRFTELYGREPERVRKIYNGKLEANLLQYPGPRPPGLTPELEGTVPTPKRIRIKP